MPTLLVGHHKWSWRDWLRANLQDRDLIVLDPANADHGPPARCLLVRAGKVVDWRLVGTLDVQKNPVAWFAASAALLRSAKNDPVVLTFPLRPSPVLRQLALGIAHVLQPKTVLVPESTRLERQPWPVGAETVPLPEELPPLVQQAQRRARWLELIENCATHELDLSNVAIEGARLGSGTRLRHDDFPDYAEISGGVLHVVTDRNIEENEVRRAMDLTHATRLSLVDPLAYNGLVCSFAHENGEDFGLGYVQSVNPLQEQAVVMCQAVVPAPVRILKIGLINIADTGKENLAANLWTV